VAGAEHETRFYAVDRIEGQRTRRKAILISDAGTEIAVPLRTLPTELEEGTVLRVEIREDGPQWATAVMDEVERMRRLRDLQARMDNLRSTDPGGDLAL
jgi:hypothetical protein